MANLNVATTVYFEFNVVEECESVALVVRNTETEKEWVIFRVYDDGSSEVLTLSLENAGLDTDVVI
jgi:hypothetical protein